MVIQPVGLDSGNHVTFILLNNKDLFSVGQTSGVVSTNGLPLDRERKDNYTLVVRVRDYFIYKKKIIIAVVVYCIFRGVDQVVFKS